VTDRRPPSRTPSTPPRAESDPPSTPRPHRDYAGRPARLAAPSSDLVDEHHEPTTPGPHVTPDEDDSHDYAPITGVHAITHDAVRVALDSIRRRSVVGSHDQILIEEIVAAVAGRLSQTIEHARQPSIALSPRVAALEEARRETDRWRLVLTGLDDRNGRLGRLDATIGSLRYDLGSSDERRAERATIGSLRWAGTKVMAGVVAIGVIVGGAAMSLRGRYDSMVEARVRDAEWRRHVDADITWFRSLFNSPRSTAP